MKNCIIILFILVAVLFIWLTFASICNLQFEPTNTAGVIVSALAGMITLLVGWQILSNIQERERMSELRKEYNSFKADILSLIEKKTNDAAIRNQNIILCTAFAQMGLSQFYNRDYANAIRTLFNALASDDENDTLQADSRQHTVEILEEIAKLSSSPGDEQLIIKVPEQDLRNFQMIALKLKNDKIIELTRRIQPITNNTNIS